METLQLAQMLADLSDLDAAEPRAAHALVTANATVTTATSTTSSTTVQQTEVTTTSSSSAQIPANPPQHRRVSSSSALSPGSSVPRNGGTSTPFDSYLGRRLLTPPITRSSSSHGSMPGTPHGNDTDSDVDRASSLIALYDLRAKLKQYNDNNSLRQAREKVAALSGRQLHQQSPHSSGDNLAGASSTSPPNPPPIARRHSQYTFPRS
ncbi:uncharacterized protein SPSK_09747 [Sporothrix schenckii 1099-18]|nr:uncharacterized protein SPSK_09747 [Sporothrix schenckii 1099-18]KJR84862.1 hypothetical protein SPSK_09747 [Sporothrix schenckii 1099-18]